MTPDPNRNGRPTVEEAVRLSAYLKWEAAGKPEGNGANYWLEAEKEHLQRSRTIGERRPVEVYRAKDSLQAHLLRSILEEEGIPALVDGDMLQGAVGELPAGWASAPRIMVEERNATQARALLERWESSSDLPTSRQAT